MTALVVRCNYGNESIALIQSLYNDSSQIEAFTHVYVVMIDTGWGASSWAPRVEQGEAFVQKCGFIPVTLKPPLDFKQMVLERKSFPSQKFQWCTTFIKTLPLLDWLDNHDPQLQWTIAIAKRQCRTRVPQTKEVKECELHGERRVIHPILEMLDPQVKSLVSQAGFQWLNSRSLECEPCINANMTEMLGLSDLDRQKTAQLESTIQSGFYSSGPNQSMTLEQKLTLLRSPHQKKHDREPSDAFSMGCGDNVGCGL